MLYCMSGGMCVKWKPITEADRVLTVWLESFSCDVRVPFNIITLRNKQSCFPGQTASDRKQEEGSETIIVSTEIIQGPVWEWLCICVCITLQVRDRVHGCLVSGSWTPQCLLGSNTLPVKDVRTRTCTHTYTDTLDLYQQFYNIMSALICLS